MDACLIIIGDEILAGRTRDANLQYLARWLGDLGIRLAEARVVRDEPAAIIRALDACRATYDYVFTTGGIGPTHDDVTSESVARAFGVDRVLDERAASWLREYYGDGELSTARLRMARVPAGADLLENPISRAPGFRIGNVFVLPGIPRIMQAMLEHTRPFLASGPPLLSRTVRALIRESAIAEELERFQHQHPEVQIGSYPFFEAGQPGVALVVRGVDDEALATAARGLMRLLAELGAGKIGV